MCAGERHIREPHRDRLFKIFNRDLLPFVGVAATSQHYETGDGERGYRAPN